MVAPYGKLSEFSSDWVDWTELTSDHVASRPCSLLQTVLTLNLAVVNLQEVLWIDTS